jgi:hypothetical protein
MPSETKPTGYSGPLCHIDPWYLRNRGELPKWIFTECKNRLEKEDEHSARREIQNALNFLKETLKLQPKSNLRIFYGHRRGYGAFAKSNYNLFFLQDSYLDNKDLIVHEATHVLTPSICNNLPFICEGLAMWIQDKYDGVRMISARVNMDPHSFEYSRRLFDGKVENAFGYYLGYAVLREIEGQLGTEAVIDIVHRIENMESPSKEEAEQVFETVTSKSLSVWRQEIYDNWNERYHSAGSSVTLMAGMPWGSDVSDPSKYLSVSLEVSLTQARQFRFSVSAGIVGDRYLMLGSVLSIPPLFSVNGMGVGLFKWNDSGLSLVQVSLETGLLTGFNKNNEYPVQPYFKASCNILDLSFNLNLKSIHFLGGIAVMTRMFGEPIYLAPTIGIKLAY